MIFPTWALRRALLAGAAFYAQGHVAMAAEGDAELAARTVSSVVVRGRIESTPDLPLSARRIEARQIELSPLEFGIVCELMSARGQPVTKTMLWDRCWVEWRFLPDNFVNIIDARISALRRRLKEATPELGDGLHPLIVSARSQSLIFRDLSRFG